MEEGEGDGRRGEERGRKMSGGEMEGDRRDGMGVRWWRLGRHKRRYCLILFASRV